MLFRSHVKHRVIRRRCILLCRHHSSLGHDMMAAHYGRGVCNTYYYYYVAAAAVSDKAIFWLVKFSNDYDQSPREKHRTTIIYIYCLNSPGERLQCIHNNIIIINYNNVPIYNIFVYIYTRTCSVKTCIIIIYMYIPGVIQIIGVRPYNMIQYKIENRLWKHIFFYAKYTTLYYIIIYS